MKNIQTAVFIVFICSMTTALCAGIEPAGIYRDTVVRDVLPVTPGKKEQETVSPVQRRFDVVVLENEYLKVIVCPQLGERILNVVDKVTGRKCLYEGLIRYSGTAYTEGGGSGGGLQINHPLYHAGSSYVAALPYTTEIAADGTAVLTMSYVSYPHLQQTVWQIRLRPDEAAFHCTYRFENQAPFAMGFNPWIDASFPMNESAQFTLPTDWIAGHWFGINPKGGDGDWGHHLRPWPVGEDGQDQSILKDRKWSAAFAYGLTGGYAGIQMHDTDTGFAHVFDPRRMPGAKAAGAWKPDGWLEVWGAFTHNMEDPRWMAPHATIQAEDLWFPFHGIGGMTWANDNGALNLRKEDDQLTCGVYVLRDHGQGAVRITADGNLLYQAGVPLKPENPFLQTVTCPVDTDEVRVTIMDSTGAILMERQQFFGPRPKTQTVLPEKPWHRKNLVTEARWQEAFTPLMAWGPWYHPPTTYAKALETTPDNVEAKIGLARSLIKEASANLFRGRRAGVEPQQQYEQAAGLLTEIVDGPSPDPRALQLLGLVQFKTGKSKEAIETFERLAGTKEDSAPVHYRLSLLAAQDDAWPKALKEAQKAVAMAPDSTLPRLLLAIAMLKAGDSEGANNVLAPVLARNPVDLPALLLKQKAAKTAGDSTTAEELTLELDRLQKLGPVQFEAAVAALEHLERGRDLDPQAVDTTRASIKLPGQAP